MVGRWLIVVVFAAGLAGCGTSGFTPSHGTGAASVGVTQGFGVGPLDDGYFGGIGRGVGRSR